MTINNLTKIMRQIFLLSHYWEGILDAGLKNEGLTSKQLFFLGIMEKECKDPPSISEMSAKTLTSRQNVMQMAKALERRGFIEIREDKHDRRSRKIYLTDAHRAYWDKRGKADKTALEKLFKSLTESDKKELKSALDQLLPYTAELYEKRNNQ